MDKCYIQIKNNPNKIHVLKKNNKVKKKINFYLCDICYKRNFEKGKSDVIVYDTIINIIKTSNKGCFICKGFFEKKIDIIITEILNHNIFKDNSRNFSIDIGNTLPVSFFDLEDYIRSLFKIKGHKNIKNQINEILREKIIDLTEFDIKFLNPDIKIEIRVFEDLSHYIFFHTRELMLLAKYNKLTRGLNQKKTSIENIYPNSEKKSIEEFIIEHITNCTGSSDIKISWTGGEDYNSLVKGSGRPVIIRVNNPQRLWINKELLIKDVLKISFEEKTDKVLDIYHHYKTKVKILIKINNSSSDIKNNLSQNINKLIGRISFKGKSKIIEKQIYNANYISYNDDTFILQLECDNGIPIKRLVGGKEFINPNISKLIGFDCECICFDVEDFILKDTRNQ